jgi:hypothetical protein
MSSKSIDSSASASVTECSGSLCSKLLSLTNRFLSKTSTRSLPSATVPANSVAWQRKIPSHVRVGSEHDRKRLPVQQDQSFVSALQELIVGGQSWKERLSRDLFKKEGMDMRVSDCPCKLSQTVAPVSLILLPNLKGTLQFSKIGKSYHGDLHYKLVPQGYRTTHGVDAGKNRVDLVLKKSSFEAFKEAEAPSAHIMDLPNGLQLVVYLFHQHRLDKKSQFGLFDFNLYLVEDCAPEHDL